MKPFPNFMTNNLRFFGISTTLCQYYVYIKLCCYWCICSFDLPSEMSVQCQSGLASVPNTKGIISKLRISVVQSIHVSSILFIQKTLRIFWWSNSQWNYRLIRLKAINLNAISKVERWRLWDGDKRNIFLR